MNCSQCNHPLPEQAKFCPQCGRPAPADPPPASAGVRIGGVAVEGNSVINIGTPAGAAALPGGYCPICGAFNEPRSTFRCRHCGREYICLEHRTLSFRCLECDSTVMLWPKDEAEMVRVPAGAFLCGDEKKPRSLAGFWIDKYPVTNERYKRFVDATKHDVPDGWDKAKRTYPPGKGNHPVTVRWNDVMAYCGWAGKRLPTEWEWEKAARGTDGRTFPWGEDWVDGKYCNTREAGIGETTPVDMYPQGASPYGVLDLSGNVLEWTASRYDLADGMVLRGSSWLSMPFIARCANRGCCNPGYCGLPVGFRCASNS